MKVELHLPDLPEVPLSVGLKGAEQNGRALNNGKQLPWHSRLRESLSSSLPLVLMALLLCATWWLVKNSPRPAGLPQERAQSSEPDYTMSEFSVERFDAAGRLKLRIEGLQMHHYPATDEVEIDGAQIRSYAPDGRLTRARARQAIGKGDASELRLLGGAEVFGVDGHNRKLWMRSEFLHAFVALDRITSDQPVQVQHGDIEMTAGGLDYTHATGLLQLKGPLRVVLPPRAQVPSTPQASSAIGSAHATAVATAASPVAASVATGVVALPLPGKNR